MSLLGLAWIYCRSRPMLAMSSFAIALGVAVLFTVLAVFSGFLEKVERSLRDFTGDAAVTVPPASATPGIREQDYLDALATVEGLEEAQPRLNYYGLVGRRGARAIDDPRTTDLSGLMLVGVDRPPAGLLMADGEAPLAREEIPEGGILLGTEFAKKAGFGRGDWVEIISFKRGSRGYPVPVRASFRVAALFSTGRYDLDMNSVLVPRKDLARMVGDPLGLNGIGLVAASGVTPEVLAERAEAALLQAGIKQERWRELTQTWRSQGGNFLRAVENQKGILSGIFFFIVLVAAYQLVATLVLTVAEKRRDIGVLGALGASPGRIVGFFVGLGLVVAVLGSGLGLLLGAWLVRNLDWVQLKINGGEPIFNAETYIFKDIPVAVDWPAVLILIASTLGAALVFSFAPAWWATRMKIVDALRR